MVRIGQKKIIFEHNGHTYEVIHNYSSSSQSFIKEDGIELNENGGVRTCEELISKKLGITKDYFKIGKIGSNTKNFIDYTTSERKNYITTFLNIDDINKKFLIAKSKLSALKKEITSVSGDLNSHEKRENVETKIENAEQEITEIDTDLIELLPKKGEITAELKNVNESLAGISINDLELRKAEKQKDFDENSQIKTLLESKLENTKEAEAEKERHQVLLASLQADLKVAESEKNNKNLVIIDTDNKIISLEKELAALGKPEDIEKTKLIIADLNNELNELKTSLKSNPLGSIINEMQISKKDVSKFLTKFINFTNFLEKYFTDLKAQSVLNTKINIELFFDDSFNESLSRQMAESKKVISTKQSLLIEKEAERAKLYSYVDQLKNLEKRPSQCVIDSCPFIRDAVAHKNVLTEISNIESEINQIKKEIELFTIKAENIQELSNLHKNFLNAYEEAQPRDNQILFYFLKEKSLIDHIKGPINTFQEERQTIIENINLAISDMSEFSSKSVQLKYNKSILETLENSDSSLIGKYNADISSFKDKLDQLKKEFSIISENSLSIENKIASEQKIVELYSKYIQATSKAASASVMLSTTLSDLKSAQSLIEKQESLKSELIQIESKIKNKQERKECKNKELSLLRISLGQITNLENKLEYLNKSYKPTETVSSALSPSTGIPLILIKMYLAETEKITNDLLKLAFNEDFKINFETSEKDFKIKVNAKGNIKDDIKLASQGEVALTTISISLALIEQSIGEYNILCLDEIDGPLDPSNRENFINILESQVNKLGIEQVFVISHNNAFDACAMDVVLLPGNSFNKENNLNNNKNIIFDYEEN